MLNLFKYLFQNFLKRKNLSESTTLETKLNRCLSVPQLFFYSISSMAGAGIYILAGHIIKSKTGPAGNLSFVIGGLSSIFAGLCYCELSSLMPQAGSCYTYTYVMIGELPAFIIGWTGILDNIIMLSSVSKAFSAVVNQVSGDLIGNFTRKYLPLANNNTIFESSADIVAASLIIILILITIIGINISFILNAVLQSIQISCLFVICIGFFIHGSPANYIADGGYAPFGIGGVAQGAAMAIFAYSGFETIANSAEEIKNPAKSIPISMFSSLGFVIFLYLLVTSGLSYMVPRLQIDEKSPFVSAFANKGLDGFKWIAVAGALIATGATKLSVTYIIGRVIYAVAKDGLLLKHLSFVNKSTQVPIAAVFSGCIIAIFLAIFVKLETLADITSMGVLLSFVTVGVDLIILRYIFNIKDNKDRLKTRRFIYPFLTTKFSFIIIFVSLLGSILLLQISIVFVIKASLPVGIVLIVISSIIFAASFILLCFFKPETQSDTFQTPLMPIAPVLTIAINLGLLLSLPGVTWIRFMAWLIIGLILYFAYGIWKYRYEYIAEEYKQLSDNSNIAYSSHDLKLENVDGKM